MAAEENYKVSVKASIDFSAKGAARASARAEKRLKALITSERTVSKVRELVESTVLHLDEKHGERAALNNSLGGDLITFIEGKIQSWIRKQQSNYGGRRGVQRLRRRDDDHGTGIPRWGQSSKRLGGHSGL